MRQSCFVLRVRNRKCIDAAMIYIGIIIQYLGKTKGNTYLLIYQTGINKQIYIIYKYKQEQRQEETKSVKIDTKKKRQVVAGNCREKQIVGKNYIVGWGQGYRTPRGTALLKEKREKEELGETSRSMRSIRDKTKRQEETVRDMKIEKRQT